MRLKPIVFFLLVGGLATFVVLRQSNPGGIIKIGQYAPDFSVKDMSGNQIRLSDYRGKLVFLNFWASWCEPCAKEMPDLDLINKTFKDRKFQMIAVSVDAVPEDAKKFYDERHLSLPWYSDPGRLVADKYHVNQYPETFIIDRNGHVIKHWWTVNSQVIAQIETYMRDQETASPTSTN